MSLLITKPSGVYYSNAWSTSLRQIVSPTRYNDLYVGASNTTPMASTKNPASSGIANISSVPCCPPILFSLTPPNSAWPDRIRTSVKPWLQIRSSSAWRCANSGISLGKASYAALPQWSRCVCVTTTASTPSITSSTDMGSSTNGFRNSLRLVSSKPG